MRQNKIIVAVDGFSSCGKSTVAKEIAAYAGYTYVDSGAMYRAVALFAIRNGWLTEHGIAVDMLKQAMDTVQIDFRLQDDGTQHTFLNHEDVEAEIRTLHVANGASRVSTLSFVREALVAQQQRMGRAKGVVMDGRDIGTVVFPEAELKLFLTALPEVRANRRFLELQKTGATVSFDEVLANVRERDERDSNRNESPLRKADDAIVVDNSEMTKPEQIAYVKQLFNKALEGGNNR